MLNRHRLLIIASLPALLLLWLVWTWQASKAQLSGELSLTGLQSPVTISRDRQGAPFIQASHDNDLAMALGFLHAQEYFFSMDLARRLAAGELSALVGPDTLALDRQHRLHRFRTRAEQAMAALPNDLQQRFDYYSLGVNQGLQQLGRKPMEYYLLSSDPQPWTAADSLLMIYSLYLDLQDGSAEYLRAHAWLAAQLPSEWYPFIVDDRHPYNTLMQGDDPDGPARLPRRALSDFGLIDQGASWYQPAPDIGSNNFALSGTLTGNSSMIGGDMHLSIGMPNLWYRASWQIADRPVVAGLTLPGAPALVSGSNGYLSWAFTNSYGNYQRLYALENLSDNGYQFAGKDYSLTNHFEQIDIKGQASDTLVVRETHLGPILSTELGPRALMWTAHQPWGVNGNLIRFEQAQHVQDLIALAPSLGIPQQSMLAADAQGNILWTIAGPIAQPTDSDGRWPGVLPVREHPRRLNPEQGYLLSANQRLFPHADSPIGLGNSANAVRAWQLEQGILELNSPVSPDQAFALMLDTRAPGLEPYRQQMIAVLARDSARYWPGRQQMETLLQGESPLQADADSQAYALVRFYRDHLLRHSFQPLADALAPHSASTRQLNASLPHALLRLTQAEPPHLLPSTFASWHDLKAYALSQAWQQASSNDQLTSWGEHNRSAFQHPLSQALPWLSPLLDAKGEPQAGDRDVPRVMTARYGASQRMLLIPGLAHASLYHAPGGQSGHALSRYYRSGLDAFYQGKPAPLMPGDVRWQLILQPETPR